MQELFAGIGASIVDVAATVVAVVIAISTLQFDAVTYILDPSHNHSSSILINDESPVAAPVSPGSKQKVQVDYSKLRDVRRDAGTTTPPSGVSGEYTQEDTIAAARRAGVLSEDEGPDYVSLRAASSTGIGKAWFLIDSDHKPAPKEKCPDTPYTPVLYREFEMNILTGAYSVQEKCTGAIFD